jgi:hypothetical protein
VAHSIVKKISIALQPGLLKQVDALAKYDYTTRSDIIRQALLQYIRTLAKPPPSVPDKLEKTAPAKEDFTTILTKYPYVSPDDAALLKFLQQQERQADDG